MPATVATQFGSSPVEYRYGAADRVLFTEQLAGESLVEDNDIRGVGAVARVKLTSGDDGNSKSREIAGTNDASDSGLMMFGSRVARKHHSGIGVLRKRPTHAIGDRLHIRSRFKAMGNCGP